MDELAEQVDNLDVANSPDESERKTKHKKKKKHRHKDAGDDEPADDEEAGDEKKRRKKKKLRKPKSPQSSDDEQDAGDEKKRRKKKKHKKKKSKTPDSSDDEQDTVEEPKKQRKKKKRSKSKAHAGDEPTEPTTSTTRTRLGLQAISETAVEEIAAPIPTPLVHQVPTKAASRKKRASVFMDGIDGLLFVDPKAEKIEPEHTFEVECLSVMREPQDFLVYPAKGYPYSQSYWLAEDNLSIQWQSSKKKVQELKISDIHSIELGQETKTFHKHEAILGSSSYEVSMSLMHGKKGKDSLDLVCSDMVAFQTWLQGIARVMHIFKTKGPVAATGLKKINGVITLLDDEIEDAQDDGPTKSVARRDSRMCVDGVPSFLFM